MKISGFGQNIQLEAEVFTPENNELCSGLLKNHQLIPHGSGLSYGDPALFRQMIKITSMRGILSFDGINSELQCHGGTTLKEILNFLNPKGLTLPILPGSSLVTVSGAMASDVHGKNHVGDGSFSQCVKSLKLMVGDGSILEVSKHLYPELFKATCGGMGLTGIILSATLSVSPLKTLKQFIKKTTSFETLFEAFEKVPQNSYGVAWLDGSTFEKSILTETVSLSPTAYDLIKPFAIDVPKLDKTILTKNVLRLFNSFYFSFCSTEECQIGVSEFHFPLEKLTHWNNLYGPQGLLQIQLVIPRALAFDGLKEIFNVVSKSDEPSYLCSLKRLGQTNHHHLSFPLEGYALALDFKNTPSSRQLLQRLEEIVVRLKGKIYLAKDSLMLESTFKSLYPDWEKFESIRAHYGAIGKFRSLQSLRLGLG